uniref:Uncharacterized protein n=1 Tax=Toxoplasma gondii COUG TaxID=1074873 RepID=A0A2G8Y9T3_TOXGO|nr:hypothetical protein TGCOUG_225920 [Toxoplasma gondii COUG]
MDFSAAARVSHSRPAECAAVHTPAEEQASEWGTEASLLSEKATSNYLGERASPFLSSACTHATCLLFGECSCCTWRTGNRENGMKEEGVPCGTDPARSSVHCAFQKSSIFPSSPSQNTASLSVANHNATEITDVFCTTRRDAQVARDTQWKGRNRVTETRAENGIEICRDEGSPREGHRTRTEEDGRGHTENKQEQNGQQAESETMDAADAERTCEGRHSEKEETEMSGRREEKYRGNTTRGELRGDRDSHRLVLGSVKLSKISEAEMGDVSDASEGPETGGGTLVSGSLSDASETHAFPGKRVNSFPAENVFVRERNGASDTRVAFVCLHAASMHPASVRKKLERSSWEEKKSEECGDEERKNRMETERDTGSRGLNPPEEILKIRPEDARKVSPGGAERGSGETGGKIPDDNKRRMQEGGLVKEEHETPSDETTRCCSRCSSTDRESASEDEKEAVSPEEKTEHGGPNGGGSREEKKRRIQPEAPDLRPTIYSSTRESEDETEREGGKGETWKGKKRDTLGEDKKVAKKSQRCNPRRACREGQGLTPCGVEWTRQLIAVAKEQATQLIWRTRDSPSMHRLLVVVPEAKAGVGLGLFLQGDLPSCNCRLWLETLLEYEARSQRKRTRKAEGEVNGRRRRAVQTAERACAATMAVPQTGATAAPEQTQDHSVHGKEDDDRPDGRRRRSIRREKSGRDGDIREGSTRWVAQGTERERPKDAGGEVCERMVERERQTTKELEANEERGTRAEKGKNSRNARASREGKASDGDANMSAREYTVTKKGVERRGVTQRSSVVRASSKANTREHNKERDVEKKEKADKNTDAERQKSAFVAHTKDRVGVRRGHDETGPRRKRKGCTEDENWERKSDEPTQERDMKPIAQLPCGCGEDGDCGGFRVLCFRGDVVLSAYNDCRRKSLSALAPLCAAETDFIYSPEENPGIEPASHLSPAFTLASLDIPFSFQLQADGYLKTDLADEVKAIFGNHYCARHCHGFFDINRDSIPCIVTRPGRKLSRGPFGVFYGWRGMRSFPCAHVGCAHICSRTCSCYEEEALWRICWRKHQRLPLPETPLELQKSGEPEKK